jgi:diacylglycerol kinase (ATP)
MPSHAADRVTAVLWNPKAGGGRIRHTWKERERQLRAVLSGAGDSLRFVQTTQEDHGALAVGALLDEEVQRIVVVGGDGTLSEAVQGFFDRSTGKARSTQATLALVPAGRGNDFLRSLVGPYAPLGSLAWDHGLRILRRGSPKPLDLVRVDFLDASGSPVCDSRLQVNVSSFGVPGSIAERVAQAAGWVGRTRFGRGAASYVLQSVQALRDYSPSPVRVRVDGREVFHGPLLWGAVLNGRFNASGFCWSSEDSVRDGLLGVNLLPALSFRSLLTQVPFMFSGEWHRSTHARIDRGCVVELEDLRPLEDRKSPLVEVDGDLPAPRATQLYRFTVLPGAVSFWQP